MVTHRATTKYTNVLVHEQASLLVDSRCGRLPLEQSKIQALTVHGKLMYEIGMSKGKQECMTPKKHGIVPI